MKSLIENIVFFTLLIKIYLITITNNINEKILLIILIIACVLFLFIKYINIKKYNSILYFLDKLYAIVLIFGIFNFINRYIILFMILLLVITIVTRIIYNKCLLLNKKIHLYSDFAYILVLFIYLYKFVKK